MTEGQRQGLMEEFMPDVEEIVREMDNGTIPFEDLMQEGFVGLVEGVNGINDDPDEWTGVSMDEQVHAAIRRAVQAALDEQKALTEKDDRLIVQVEMLNASIDKLTTQLGSKPTIDELANELGVSQDKVIEILKLTGEVDEEKLKGPVQKKKVPHHRHHDVI